MGLNTFRTAYTMKDGTVVNEQAAFEGYIRNGGGFVAIHGADDSMSQLAASTSDMLGGTFRAHPGNASGFGTDCGSCYWAELINEDNTHPADAAGLPARFAVADELYQYDRKPRPYVHPLLLLNEDTYRTGDRRRHRRRRHRGRRPSDHVLLQLQGRADVRPGARAQLAAVHQHRVVPADDPRGDPHRRRASSRPTA